MSEFVRASWSRRFIAYTIDNIIVEVFWIVLIIGLIALTPLSLNDVIDVIDPGNDIWSVSYTHLTLPTILLE